MSRLNNLLQDKRDLPAGRLSSGFLVLGAKLAVLNFALSTKYLRFIVGRARPPSRTPVVVV